MNTNLYPASFISRTREKIKTFQEKFLPWLVLTVMLGVSFLLWQAERHNAAQDLQNEFDVQVGEVTGRIEQRMLGYEQMLNGIDGLFAASDSVSRKAFHGYVVSLNSQVSYPGIQEISFLPLIAYGQKSGHIAEIRKQGFPQYTINPQGERSSYAPFTYIEPLGENSLHVLGFDSYSDTAFRYALEQARDSNRAIISGKVRPSGESGQELQADFMMSVPVYKYGFPHETLAERRANIIGWVSASFRMNDLMAGILGKLEQSLDIEIYDGMQASAASLLHDSDKEISVGRTRSQYQTSRSMQIGGRNWTVVMRSLAGFDARLEQKRALLMLILGVSMSLLLFLLTLQSQFRRRRATSMAKQLAESEANLRSILDNSPYLIWLKDAEGRYIAVNQAFLKLSGRTCAQDLHGKNDFDIWPRELAEKYRADDAEVMRSARQKLVEEQAVNSKGEKTWVETFKAPILDKDGKLLGTSGFARDMTERREHEEALQLAATVFDGMSEAVAVTDGNNLIVAVNHAFTVITGYTLDEVRGKNPRVLSSGSQPPAFYQALWKTLKSSGNWQGEIWNRRKSGEVYAQWLSINLVYDAQGLLIHYVAVFSDISERKASEQRIHHLAHYDVLTDLPNRALFTDRLYQSITQAKRDKAHLALMFLDLDKFKPINDELGHDIGDLLLKEVAQRMQRCLRESDTVARIGGDEFVVLLPNIESERNALLVAEKVLNALNQTFIIAGNNLNISASIGVAVYPEHGETEKMLVKNADIAMYLSKKSGRNSVKLYQPGMADNTQECKA